MNIGNYKVIQQINEGGFGRIYQAEHTLIKEYACLKQNIRETPEDVELLRKEAKLLWRLSSHHSIPSAKDFFMVGKNNGIMVMDYIEGQTLDQLVEKNSAIHPEDACRIGERVLSALLYCHFYGVIHTDIKPENIFINPKKDELDIKLIDFGLATLNPDSTTKPVGYTERYVAPELLRGQPPLPETDIYGAGIVILYALGGDVTAKTFPKRTPPEIIDFVNRLLRYDPTERPSWEHDNPLARLSDVRLKVFGRRHRT